MKVIIFGVGKYYQNRKYKLLDNVEIVAFIDNNSSLWGTIIDGVKVISPEKTKSIVYDRIILMSVKAYEMGCQLINMGIEKEKIFSFDEFLCGLERGKLKVYFDGKIEHNIVTKKKILIISTTLGYNGGTLAAVYFAKAIKNRGYQVCIAAPDGNMEFIKEMVDSGIKIIIYKNIIYFRDDELFWVNDFDIVVINTLQMMRCAYKIKKIKKTLWWLHESLVVYKNILDQNLDIKQKDFRNIDIYAVSELAKNNFNRYYPDTKVGILTYGIPDVAKNDVINYSKDKLVFAIIGGVSKIKGHDILLSAMQRFTKEERTMSEIWIIGAYQKESEYFKELQNMLQENTDVKFLGELDRKEIDTIYSNIDVVLNPSRQDSCPIVIAEGLMHSKICVTTNATGMAHYIEDERNGFVCTAEDSHSLYQKISWIISHKNELDDIRKNARATYEKYFTMERFGENLEKILDLKE